MMLPVFKEIFDNNVPNSGCIFCINNDHVGIKPMLYDVLGIWPDGSLLFRNISSGEITDNVSRFTHFTEIDHLSDILDKDVIWGHANIVLLDNVTGDVYTVDDGVTSRSLARNYDCKPIILVMRLYEGANGCVITEGEHTPYDRNSCVGKVDVFSAVSKKKYYGFTESSNDFTVFEFKEVTDVV